MDFTAQRNNLFRAGIVFIVCAVIIVVIVVIFMALPRKTQKQNLAYYLPENTIFSAEVPRQQLFDMSYEPLAKHPDVQSMTKIVQSFWTGLETVFSVQNDRVMWFVAREEDGLHQGIVIQTRSPISKKNLSTYLEQSYPDLSWYGTDQEQLRFFRLTPYIYAMYHRELTLSSSAVPYASSMVSVYAADEFIQWLTVQNKPTSTFAFSELMSLRGPVLVQADFSDGKAMFQLTEPGSRVSTSTDPVSDFMVPQNFDVVIAGELGSMMDNNAASTILGATIRSFLNIISNSYSVDQLTVRDRLIKMDGLITAGSDWVVISDDQDAVTDFANELASWFSPRTESSILSDGSPYRELVKNHNNSTTDQMIGGYQVTLWSYSTSTIGFAESETLYGFSQDNNSYLTNSLSLVNEYTRGNTHPILNDARVRWCASNFSGQALYAQSIAILQNLKIPLAEKAITAILVGANHNSGYFESVCLE